MKLKLQYKFLIVTVTLLATAVLAYLLLAVKLFEQDKTSYVYEGNATLVSALASETDNNLSNSIRSMQLLTTTFNQDFKTETARTLALQRVFEADDQLVYIAILGVEPARSESFKNPKLLWQSTQESFIKPYNLPSSVLETHRQKMPPPYLSIFNAGLQIQNASIKNTLPLLSVGITSSSRSDGAVDQIAIAYLRQDRRIQLFSKSETFTTYLVDTYGNILAHPKMEMITNFKTIAGSEILKQINQAQINTGVRRYVDKSREATIFAYSKLKAGNLLVISEIPEKKAFLATKKLIEKSVMFAVLIIAIAFIVSVLFAKTITRSLSMLYGATERIMRGDFQVSVAVNSGDEVGALSQSFNKMASEISRLMAETADKARMEKELETAQLVQDSFFPIKEATMREFELASFYTPASECGGDWWGHIPMGQKVAVMIGDATGHGVPSALITAAAHSCCTTLEGIKKEFPQIELSPALILEKLNRSIYAAGRGRIRMTFFVAVFDLETGEIQYANAAHEMPYICRTPSSAGAKRSKKDIVVCSGQPGFILGQDIESKYTTHKIDMQPGDAMLMYTDGLVECKSPEEKPWGKGTLIRQVFSCAHEGAAKMRDTIANNAMTFFGGRMRDDDVTMVVIRRKEKGASNTLSRAS